MDVDRINLGLVTPILEVITRVVGCDGGCFTITMRVGEYLYLDLLDDDFSGVVPRAALGVALSDMGKALGHTINDRGACPSEGVTLTLQFFQRPGGIDFQVGV